MLPDGFKATFRVGFIYSDQFPAKFLSFPLRFVFEAHQFPVNVQVHKYVVSVDQFDLRFSPGSISRLHYPGDSQERRRESSVSPICDSMYLG